ncbi:Uncharacterized membrane protein YcaP, DUF421 family [Actinopolyspora xinjiangensis]|uniref:Uncharacterized membrane protein YcaP, DUF421 family n=1 Tax=Actinopolyspora xinjiangensis TaxID=405564 RepID=A0A1H0WT45_9ACTN|nr:YetF domain-containing protein [Actinopolyspora xinjiangensis]SDP93871.1 Uncharacterized membrane protein YcaP, DUF421 family [Actinopolyspora xinjiangensis]
MTAGLHVSWQTLALVAISTVSIYVALIAFSRIAGLRSFSQMTNFDYAATVAFGSITATTAVSSEVSLLQGMFALAALFTTQSLLAYLRKHGRVERLSDNRPLLLMDGCRELRENLDQAQMTRNDLYAKLRLAGITRLEQVEAVVLETTGEVSVLTVDPEGRPVDSKLLASVDGPQPPVRDDLSTHTSDSSESADPSSEPPTRPGEDR